jgi:hypothetical protein
MMAALILACSIVFLLQFFVSYCRSLIAASAKHDLSAEVLDVTGLSRNTSGEDFARVVQLLLLCPDRPDDRSEVRAVGAYFRLLNFVRATLARIVPSAQAWIERERAQCTYFAAVTLDRRIAFSRDLLAQQIEA